MKSELSSSLVCNLDQMTYLSPQGSSVLGTFQARILEWVAISSSWDLPDPGTEPRSSALQVGSLPSEPPRNPKNTRAGSLTLLQGIFLTEESNQGPLHCRQILSQLSYEGSHYEKQIH